MKAEPDKAVLCGFPVNAYDLNHNCEVILKNVLKEQGQWVVTLNLEMIYRSNADEKYQELLHKADLFIADGVPLLWASHLKKNIRKIAGRSNGTDLVEKLLRSAIDFKIAVIGGKNPASTVKKYNPGLLKNGYFYDGIVDLNDQVFLAALINDLKEHKSNLVFLSLGVPKQDVLAYKIRKHIPSVTVIGVGGSFDILSGRKSRAPKWMQKKGLEWFYRLLTEPKRLAKRYMVHYPQALWSLIKDVI